MSNIGKELRLSDNKKQMPHLQKHGFKKSTSDANLCSAVSRIRDYELIKEIGRGAYGTVHLAHKEDSQTEVAIKVLDKLFLSKQEGKSEEALIERDILSMCNHPSIIKIIASFQNKTKLFYVLEYAPNRDLDFLLRRFGTLPQVLAKCYAAEILNALEYLHRTMHTSHNDLKPGNIMLDTNYHLKIIDFSTAKIDGKKYDMKQKQFVDTDTFECELIGTPEYCSPEIISKELYDYKTNDIWAFGCMLYYFYHGRTPFKGTNDYKTFANIKVGDYTINNNINEDVKDLIRKILVLDPKKRFGCSEENQGITHLKSHPYFKGIDWKNLTDMQVPIPVELLKKLSSKQASETNTAFWANICNEINAKNVEEVVITNNENYFIIEDFYYKEKESVSRLSNEYSLRESSLVYEGIVTKLGIIKIPIKLRLLNTKKLLCINNNKKGNLDCEINLSKSLQMSIENDMMLKIIDGSTQYTFKTTKLEAVKWYNFINQTIFAE